LLSAVHALRANGKKPSPASQGKELQLTLDAMKLKRLQQHLYELRGDHKVQGTGESDRIISPAAVKRENVDAQKLWTVLKDKKLNQVQLNTDDGVLGNAEGKLLEAVKKLKQASPQTHKDQDKELSLTMDLLKLKELEQRIATNSGLKPQNLKAKGTTALAPQPPVVSVKQWRHAERDLDRFSDRLHDQRRERSDRGRDGRRDRRDRYRGRHSERWDRDRRSRVGSMLAEHGPVPNRHFVKESADRTLRLQADLNDVASGLTPHEYERDQKIVSEQKHSIIRAVDALDSHGVQGRIERTRELSLTTDAQRLEQLSLRLSQEHDIKSAQASQLEQKLARKDEENTRLRQKLLRLSARVKGR